MITDSKKLGNRVFFEYELETQNLLKS